MKLFKKIYWLIFPVLVVIFMILTKKIFQIEEVWMNSIISVFAAFILSPIKKKIETQTGKKTQITWIFLKEPIFID